MGLLDQAESMIEHAAMQRIAGGIANFSNPGSGDHQALGQLISQSSPQQVQNAFSQSAQQMDPGHFSPPGGSSPFAQLEKPALTAIASMFIAHLTGGGGFSPASLLNSVPQLQTADPSQMDANQVAKLAQFTQQNHPNLFGAVASQLGQQQPGLLGSLLGKAGMSSGASALASFFLNK